MFENINIIIVNNTIIEGNYKTSPLLLFIRNLFLRITWMFFTSMSDWNVVGSTFGVILIHAVKSFSVN